MAIADQKLFLDAAAKASREKRSEWGASVAALCRMSMPDMLQAFAGLSAADKFTFFDYCISYQNKIGAASMNRIRFVHSVVVFAEIRDFGLNDDNQVNDGRQYLGCTRLDDQGVQENIDKAIAAAKTLIANKGKGTDFAASGTLAAVCCGEIGVAWQPILVSMRRSYPNASLNANIAAAAHYMLARYHTCMGKAAEWQMNGITKGYDAQKRATIAGGDKELKSMALSANRPFPPDYAIASWAFKGAADGARDCARCNQAADVPWVIPLVNDKEWGFE